MSDSVSYPAIRSIPRRPEIRDSLHVRLFMMQSLTIPAGRWNTRNVQSPFWRFYRNVDPGAFITLSGGTPFEFEPERVYFVPSGVRFSCGNFRTFRHFYIHFDLLGLSRLTLNVLFDGPVVLPEDISFSAQVAAFAEEIAVGTGPPDVEAYCRAKGLVFAGLAAYLGALPPERRERAEQASADQDTIAPALACIESDLSAPLTIPLLAERCYLSPDHFARRFKAIVGRTPGDYIREQRVMQAAQRLLFTEDSLEEIAACCGFGSRHYLTRVFTQIMGVPPATYRRGENLSARRER